MTNPTPEQGNEEWRQQFEQMWSEHDGDHFYKDEWLAFIEQTIARERKEVEARVMEVIEERITHWQKRHDESMLDNTLIRYHADSCIRALTNLKRRLTDHTGVDGSGAH